MRTSTTPAPSKDGAPALLRHAARAALEKKAADVVILELAGRASYCDWFLLCNGTNVRQVQAIAEHVVDTLKKEHGLLPIGVEGLPGGRWVLVDYGDVVVHVFEEAARGHYDLDGLWLDVRRVPVDDLEEDGAGGRSRREVGAPG